MSDDTVLVPGGRDVRASLDASGDGDGNGDAVVVACPPHPRHRGHRGDERLVAVGEALVARGVDCLRFDYGPWDEGYGEREDVRNAVRWAAERYDRVGVFGYSFGATLALATAGGGDAPAASVAAASALAPTARLGGDGRDPIDAVAALARIDRPAQVLYGTRDDTVDWRPVVERARERGFETVELDADHFLVGRATAVGRTVAAFLAPRLAVDGA